MLNFHALGEQEFSIVFIDAGCVVQQELQILNILFHHSGDVFQQCQFVAIVLLEHAPGTHQLVTAAAEILNLFLLVLEAEDTVHVCQAGPHAGCFLNEFAFNAGQFEPVVEVFAAMCCVLLLAHFHNLNYFRARDNCFSKGPLSAQCALLLSPVVGLL